MSLVYLFVDEKIRSGLVTAKIQVDIPHLWVVYVVVAVPHESNGMNSTTATATYLLEEKITSNFVKYINNNLASPPDWLNGKPREMAVFLCFIQCVQYYLTEGMVYLSNFQGELLSYIRVTFG